MSFEKRWSGRTAAKPKPAKEKPEQRLRVGCRDCRWTGFVSVEAADGTRHSRFCSCRGAA